MSKGKKINELGKTYGRGVVIAEAGRRIRKRLSAMTNKPELESASLPLSPAEPQLTRATRLASRGRSERDCGLSSTQG